jgi:hypothetical protein
MSKVKDAVTRIDRIERRCRTLMIGLTAALVLVVIEGIALIALLGMVRQNRSATPDFERVATGELIVTGGSGGDKARFIVSRTSEGLALMLGDAAGGLQATLVASKFGPTFVLGEPGRAQVELSVRDGLPAIRMRDANGKRIWTAP